MHRAVYYPSLPKQYDLVTDPPCSIKRIQGVNRGISREKSTDVPITRKAVCRSLHMPNTNLREAFGTALPIYYSPQPSKSIRQRMPDCTLVWPDLHDLLTGMSMLLSTIITEASTNSDHQEFYVHEVDCTSPEDLLEILKRVQVLGRWSNEIPIIALVLINRLYAYGKVEFHCKNWKALLMVSLMIAHKSWDDCAVKSIEVIWLWNRIFTKEKNPTLAELNAMERQVLSIIEYNVRVSPSLYAKYYFALRSLVPITKSHQDDDRKGISKSACSALRQITASNIPQVGREARIWSLC